MPAVTRAKNKDTHPGQLDGLSSDSDDNISSNNALTTKRAAGQRKREAKQAEDTRIMQEKASALATIERDVMEQRADLQAQAANPPSASNIAKVSRPRPGRTASRKTDIPGGSTSTHSEGSDALHGTSSTVAFVRRSGPIPSREENIAMTLELASDVQSETARLSQTNTADTEEVGPTPVKQRRKRKNTKPSLREQVQAISMMRATDAMDVDGAAQIAEGDGGARAQKRKASVDDVVDMVEGASSRNPVKRPKPSGVRPTTASTVQAPSSAANSNVSASRPELTASSRVAVVVDDFSGFEEDSPEFAGPAHKMTISNRTTNKTSATVVNRSQTPRVSVPLPGPSTRPTSSTAHSSTPSARTTPRPSDSVPAVPPKTTKPRASNNSIPDILRPLWHNKMIPVTRYIWGNGTPVPWSSPSFNHNMQEQYEWGYSLVYSALGDGYANLIGKGTSAGKLINQRISEWRGGFPLKAEGVVDAFFTAKKEDGTPVFASAEEIRQYVIYLLQAADRECPDILSYPFVYQSTWLDPGNKEHGVGRFLHPMVLETLNYHIEQIAGVEEIVGGETDYPDGGLAMSLTALEWAIFRWADGAPPVKRERKESKEDTDGETRGFTFANWCARTKWWATQISGIDDNKWAKILAGARKYCKTTENSAEEDNGFELVLRGSSPAS